MEIHTLIKGCIAIERAAASIYSNFMRAFPEEKAFWEDLYNDEIGHSSFLADAGSQGLFNGLKVHDLPVTVPLIEKTLQFADNIHSHVQFNPVSFEEACRLALKLEETMVETFTNDVIAHLSGSRSSSFLKRILGEEKAHIEKIRDIMISKGFMKLS
ncbi:MAG: hypothetical protein AB1552_05505 [Nitrospirota bacterium]